MKREDITAAIREEANEFPEISGEGPRQVKSTIYRFDLNEQWQFAWNNYTNNMHMIDKECVKCSHEFQPYEPRCIEGVSSLEDFVELIYIELPFISSPG